MLPTHFRFCVATKIFFHRHAKINLCHSMFLGVGISWRVTCVNIYDNRSCLSVLREIKNS